ncbi:MAG: hypothetical protein JXQ99_22900 [Hyphomicrobiaceae bacterium]
MAQSGTDVDIRSSQTEWRSHLQAGLRLLPLVLVAAVAIGYALRLIHPATLWLDEAMLFVNVRDIAWHELLAPLPFYDQAAPVAYIALLKLIHSLAGLQESLLRLPSFLALLATFALITRLPDTCRTTRILMAALLAGSFVTARIATDAKPYMFEALFAFAMMIAFHPATRGFWASTPFRLGLLGLAMLTTTAFPLVAFAIGAPLILSIARMDLTAGRPFNQWRCVRPAAIFAAALAFYTAYFAGYLSPSLKLIAANHAYGYGPSGFAPDSAFYPMWFAGRLLDIIASHWQSMAPFIAIAALVGGYALSRRASVYALQAGTLLGLVVTANIAGFFPVMEERFSVFLLPWLILCAASGLTIVLRKLPSTLAQPFAAAVLTAALLGPAVDTLRDPFHQQAHASLAHIHAKPTIPLHTTMAGQPIVDAYLSGASKNRSDCAVAVAAGTTDRCTAPRQTTDGMFKQAGTKWYLMNYIAIASWGGSDHGFPGASIAAFSADYYDWIVGDLRRSKRAHLLVVQGNTHMVEALRQRLQRNETLTRIVDERPASPTLAHSAGQLFLFDVGAR